MTPYTSKLNDLMRIKTALFPWITSLITDEPAPAEHDVVRAVGMTEYPTINLIDKAVPCVVVRRSQVVGMLAPTNFDERRMVRDHDRFATEGLR